MAKLITVYWRDIPAQVIGKVGRNSVKKVLSERFAKAIDRAAMRAGKGSSDAYLSEWRRVSSAVSGDIDQAVQDAARSLEAQFDDQRLEALIKTKGLDSDPAGKSE